MKRCTYCGEEYPEEATICSIDQQPLESAETPASHWPPQVVVPAVLWGVALILVTTFFTPVGGLFFLLLTAIWAAIDCSKLKSKGSRVLGLAFKPVVVFAVVAFLWCPFGFIWYLIMRHRVKTAPMDLQTEGDVPRFLTTT